LHHKAGFALKWMSDNVFVEEVATGDRFIVALAGYPGRESLDQASLLIGKLLARGERSLASGREASPNASQ
jgi:hypothetical protein